MAVARDTASHKMATTGDRPSHKMAAATYVQSQ